MPGTQTPGRREPVRGDTSLSSSYSSSSASSSPLLALLPSQPSSSSSRLPLHPADNNDFRGAGLSSTASGRHSSHAPAAAVPITTAVPTSTYFPPSPPSTVASADSPPASPLVNFGTIHLADDTIVEEGTHSETENPWREGPHNREEGEAQDKRTVTPERPEDLHLESTNRHSVLSPSSASKPPQTSFAQRQKMSADADARHRRTMSAMPDTPRQTPTTISPAVGGYAHHPTASGQRFLCSLLQEFPLQKGAEHVIGTVSDAGVDLVCRGWSGAVLDQSRLASYSMTTAGPLSSDTTGRALFTLLPAVAQAERLREEVLSILDLASEELKCDVVFMAVDRMGMEESDWKAILHGLCYVGGSVVATGGLKGDAGKEKLTGCRVKEGLVLVAVEL